MDFFVGRTIALRGLSLRKPGQRHNLIVCPHIVLSKYCRETYF